ncbi:GNAT family N-acetyltransferase [Psychrobacillus sp. OK032]|uniref:GNAT family N-acetyltransferase n=1 Tax=Psychrobacillus sp. OK032 TaxID=1884358 RepID=UPI0008C08287|nr:GNAT family N-acetyltransferase [Psychrobacillus sp. OK032]SER70124.1 Acetyltransferase (GNAT) family protein [Psychrobacillus sp. OK032]
MIIEELKLKDKEQAKQVLVNSYMQYEETFKPKEHWLRYLGDIKAAIDDPTVEKIFVAKHEGKIVGTASMYANSDVAYPGTDYGVDYTLLRYLAVTPKSRGLGVARALLEVGIQYTFQKNEPYMYLFTGEMMTSAIHLYEKYGFDRDPQVESKFMSTARCYRIKSGVLEVQKRL